MNDKIICLGLIGKDVSKSSSDRIHGYILRQEGYALEYEKISVTGEGFDGEMRRLLGDFDGFNVTIPYKRDVMEYLDEVVGDAFAFGSVNTVVSRTRAGYNTDGAGFMLMIRLAGIETQGKKILVLGGGGSGRSTAAALKRQGGLVSMYRRDRAKLEETCMELGVTPATDPNGGGYDILINATGVGMHDSVGSSPVTAAAFAGASAAIDLIYYPRESEFLRLAKAQGLQTLNGEGMLFYQAYYADCLFLGISPNDGRAKALYEGYTKEREGEQP